MSLLIKGMEMPEDGSWKTIRIYPDGTCAVPNWQGDCTLIKGAQAISVPPHGRLIDADALIKLLDNCMFPSDMVTTRAVSMARNWLIDAPTIIESEE